MPFRVGCIRVKYIDEKIAYWVENRLRFFDLFFRLYLRFLNFVFLNFFYLLWRRLVLGSFIFIRHFVQLFIVWFYLFCIIGGLNKFFLVIFLLWFKIIIVWLEFKLLRGLIMICYFSFRNILLFNWFRGGIFFLGCINLLLVIEFLRGLFKRGLAWVWDNWILILLSNGWVFLFWILVINFRCLINILLIVYQILI